MTNTKNKPRLRDTIIVCPDCGEKKNYFCKGRCKSCYIKYYNNLPHVKERMKKYMKEYGLRPYVKEKMKKYYAREDVKARIKKYQKWYYSKPDVVIRESLKQKNRRAKIVRKIFNEVFFKVFKKKFKEPLGGQEK